MELVKVGNVKLGVIKAILREKCHAINRPWLDDVNGSEIMVLKLSQRQVRNVFICSIRGMTYKIDTKVKNPSVAIFDPVIFSGKSTRVTNTRSDLSLE